VRPGKVGLVTVADSVTYFNERVLKHKERQFPGAGSFFGAGSAAIWLFTRAKSPVS